MFGKNREKRKARISRIDSSQGRYANDDLFNEFMSLQQSMDDKSFWEDADTVQDSMAFLMRYGCLSVILFVLALGIVLVVSAKTIMVIPIYGALLIVGWYFLSRLELQHTPIGVQRFRIEKLYELLMQQITFNSQLEHEQMQNERLQSRQDFELEKLRIQNRITDDKYRFINDTTQGQKQQQQSGPGREYDVVNPGQQLARAQIEMAQGEVVRSPGEPEAIKTAQSFILNLYEKGTKGAYKKLRKDGAIKKGVQVPWQNGKMSQQEKVLVEDWLYNISPQMMRWDSTTRSWVLNLSEYPSVHSVTEKFGQVSHKGGNQKQLPG